MTQSKRGLVSGWAYGQIWKVKDCYSYGQTADVESVSTPATSHAYFMNDVKTSNLPQISRNTLTFTGGDTILGATMFGASEIPNFTFDTASADADLVALVSLSSVDQTTNTEWSTYGPNNNLGSLPLCGLSLHSQFQTFGESCDGAVKWLNIIFPSCRISPSMPSPGFQAEAPSTYQVQPSFTGKQPNGDAFDSNTGFFDNREMVYGIISDYPIAITVWFADGVATTFNTAYRPIDTVITINATKNHFCVNGTPTALTSIVVATGLATAAAAGSDGDINVLMYETQFTAV